VGAVVLGPVVDGGQSGQVGTVVGTIVSFAGGEAGILDDKDLVNFDTLHNMQHWACQVFESKKLFGTYLPELKSLNG